MTQLAKTLDNFVQEYDPWGYRDSECSVEYFEDLIDKNPKLVIAELLIIAEDMKDIIKEVQNV